MSRPTAKIFALCITAWFTSACVPASRTEYATVTFAGEGGAGVPELISRASAGGRLVEIPAMPDVEKLFGQAHCFTIERHAMPGLIGVGVCHDRTKERFLFVVSDRNRRLNEELSPAAERFLSSLFESLCLSFRSVEVQRHRNWRQAVAALQA